MAYREIAENRLARFQKRITIDTATGCWNWDKVATFGGYGVSSYRGVSTVAHRAVWLFLRGDIPADADLDHLCRNRLCVNPDHLEPVSRRENLRRGFVARGCVNGHPYIAENYYTVQRTSGLVETRCKVCHRARNKASKARRKMRCDPT